jgi:hypothetical protein
VTDLPAAAVGAGVEIRERQDGAPPQESWSLNGHPTIECRSAHLMRQGERRHWFGSFIVVPTEPQ